MRAPARVVLGRTLCRLAGSIRGFLASRSGSTAIEYTVIAGLVSTAIVASLGMIAGPLGQLLLGAGPGFAPN